MASSSLQLLLSASGLPVDLIASLNKTLTNANSVPKLEFKDLTTSESSVVITNGNRHILICALEGNSATYYTSFATGFTATDGQPNHPTEFSLLSIPVGGDTIYFRMAAGTATVLVFQF